MPDWTTIKAEYIAGGTSYRKLAEKYGVAFSAVRRKAEAEKWRDLRTQSVQKAGMKIVEKVASQKAKKADRFSSIADILLQQIEDMVESGEWIKHVKMRDITGAIKDLKEIKGVKNNLDMKEQKARIAKLQKEINAKDDDRNEGKEIKITLAPELQDYSQ